MGAPGAYRAIPDYFVLNAMKLLVAGHPNQLFENKITSWSELPRGPVVRVGQSVRAIAAFGSLISADDCRLPLRAERMRGEIAVSRAWC